MKVQVYAVNQDTGEQSAATITDLDSMFDSNDDVEFFTAQDALLSNGRYWLGGGASQLFLLMRA